MSTRTSKSERHASEGRGSSLLAWLGEFAEEAGELVRERVSSLAERTVQAARDEAEQLEQRIAARLRRAALRAALAGGALLLGAGLLLSGLAGALGEAFGRPWLGQLVVGAVVLIAAAIALALARRRRRLAEAAARAADEAEDRDGSTPASTLVSVGAASWLAGLLLLRKRRD